MTAGGEQADGGTTVPVPIAWFRSLTFWGGVRVELPPTGVVAFVGPNNVGKSTALLELQGYIRAERFEFNNVVGRVFIDGAMEIAEEPALSDWFDQFADAIQPDPIYRPDLFTYRNWSASVTQLRGRWLSLFREPTARHNLQQFLVSNGASAAFDGPTPNYYGTGDPMGGGSNRQFEQLFLDPGVEARISALSERVFGERVSLWRPGSRSVLHWGPLPVIDGLSPSEQRSVLATAPKVSEQGMGVQALLNLAITMELGAEPLVVLDEPEVHLHPPQAKAAGRFVGERGRRSQVFIATHSVEFLLGVVDAGVDVTVIRLDRSGARPYASVLSATGLRQSWNDVSVRYSGVLAGLMHRGVVLCEGESDCRYLEVALDHLNPSDEPHDLRFVHAGGKAGFPKLLAVLNAIAVPVVVVSDFDLLRDWTALKQIYELLGGDAQVIEADWRVTNDLLKSQGDPRSLVDIAREVSEALANLIDNDVEPGDKRVAADVGAIVKRQDGWSKAKDLGTLAVLGPTHIAVERLLGALKSVGLLPVPTGQLESFHPEVNTSLHGPRWVAHVLENELYKNLSADKADFVREIPGALGGGASTTGQSADATPDAD